MWEKSKLVIMDVEKSQKMLLSVGQSNQLVASQPVSKLPVTTCP